MPAPSRRRLKLPVVSRLTIAWIMFAALIGGFLALAAWRGDKPLIALELPKQAAMLAPPKSAPPPLKETPQTAAAATLREAPVEDLAASEPEILDQPIDPSADVVITVDGAPAQDAADMRAGRGEFLTRIVRVADPDPALETRTAFGRRPIVGSDGRRAERVYARPFSNDGRPKVGLIVGGLGLNRALTERAIKDLPPEISLAFAPYARGLDAWSAKARADGHEVLIELPMEAEGPDGRSGQILGPAALLTGRETAENLQRLDWLLSRLPAAFGATNYLGSKFSRDPAMTAILRRLNDAGLAYVDDTGSAPRAASARIVAPGAGARSDLDALVGAAAAGKRALGKTYLDEATLEAVRDWVRELDDKNVALAPASAVVAAAGGEI